MMRLLLSSLLLLPLVDVVSAQRPLGSAPGVLHSETYTTKYVQGLTDHQGGFVVYTPAGYDAGRKPGYPVLYLLHGWGGDERAWVAKGHVDATLDRLIGNGTVRPMVVVMPLGYGDMTFLANGFEVWRDEDQISRNVNLFGETLLKEIVPEVEKRYNVATDRDHRAIAGLSMGGQEALTLGLRNPDVFAWVGGFSSAMFPVAGQDLTKVDAAGTRLRLLWVACGTEDDLLSVNRIFAMHMKQQGVPITVVETPGRHEWGVWRDNLRHFLPLLFQDGVSAGAAGR